MGFEYTKEVKTFLVHSGLFIPKWVHCLEFGKEKTSPNLDFFYMLRLPENDASSLINMCVQIPLIQ